jgi:hypothetical protein
VLVAHTCTPSYSGGRDKENSSLKPAAANSSRDSISKKKTHHRNRAGRVAQSEGPEFKSYTVKKKTSFFNNQKKMYKRVLCVSVGIVNQDILILIAI